MRSIQIKPAAALVAAMAVTSCTTVQPGPEPNTSSPTPQLSSTLHCQDAWEGSPLSVPEAPAAQGVSSLSWTGSPPSYTWPIRDEMNGYPYTANGGRKYGAWKTPISMEAGSGERVVTIDAPSDAALIIASATEWESSEALRDGPRLTNFLQARRMR